MVSIGDPLHAFLHGGRLFDGAELDLNLPSLFVKPDELFQGALIRVQIGEVGVPFFTNERAFFGRGFVLGAFLFLLLSPPIGYFLRQSNCDEANAMALRGDPHSEIQSGGAIGERGWILETQPASLPLPETKRSRDRPRERG